MLEAERLIQPVRSPVLAATIGQTRPATCADCAAPLLPAESSRCNVAVASPLEHIVEVLKALPPPKLQMAADYIHRLKDVSEEERKVALARTFGCLSPEEADEMERVIEEGCEQINERAW